MKKIKIAGLSAGLAASSIWGGLYVASKIVLDVVPPFTLLTIRLVIAALILGVILASKKWRGFSRKEAMNVFGIGVLGYGFSLGLQFVGTRLSTAANGAVITSATPGFIFLFAPWILGEKNTPRKIAALALSSIGVLLVLNIQELQLKSDLFLGNVCLLGAGLTWGLYSVLIRKVTKNLRTLPVSFVAFLGGLIVSLPAAYWEINSIGIGEISSEILWEIFYISVVATAVGAYLWNLAFELLDAGLASLTFFAQPVFGTIFGVLILGERITPLFITGGIMIGLGLILAAENADRSINDDQETNEVTR
ncbi:MAG: DMT family transporter [Anaerolineae bacterium]|nr:DMT family transporter [Anaerolineae bacterium]